MNFNNQFDRFADVIADLPEHFASERPLPADLRISDKGHHEIFYAPFDHVTTSAKIVLVGITPGRVQAIEAIAMARRALRAGRDRSQALAEAKNVASFAGPMRRNLIDLLDAVGVARRLGIRSTSEFWDSQTHLVHFTSALRYPVFDREKNYAGSGLMRSPLLRTQLETWFASECRGLPNALFVPLGSSALAACEHLQNRGDLRDDQILRGLPHPSGANAERIAYFLKRKAKEMLSVKTVPESLDAGREVALRTVADWPGNSVQ